MKLPETLTYDDVLLVPQYSNIESRKEIDVGSSLDDNIRLKLPIISSPMDTVTETKTAIAMYQAGGLGIIHRYNSIKRQVELVRDASVEKIYNVGAAIGVTEDFEERACALYDAGANVICVDVAHGHHILVERAIKTLRSIFGGDIHIMAGNVATLAGFNDLADWGADSIRCNIGGGSICSTRIQTGHGAPGLHTIMECAKTDREAKIIADGGIKNSGDIVKALAAGADFVMLGSLLAGTAETPGEKVTTFGGVKKRYRGMASKDAQIDWRGKYNSNEGVSVLIDHKGPIKEVLTALHQGIVSGFSYSGCKNITELQTTHCFAKQTPAGWSESQTHILTK